MTFADGHRLLNLERKGLWTRPADVKLSRAFCCAMAKPTSKTESRWRTEFWELPFIKTRREWKPFVKLRARRARRRAMQRIRPE